MAIDDPIDIELSLAREDAEAENYLPDRLLRMVGSATIAAALAQMPLVAQPLISLISSRSKRFDERFIRVMEEMNEQLKKNAEKIQDRSYYHSEEFQTLIGLLVERLNTTHDSEKLKMFGRALANSGNPEFQGDPREDYIHILRDLSAADLLELQRFAPRRPPGMQPELDNSVLFGFRHPRWNLSAEPLSRTGRLVGLGLVTESLKMKEFQTSETINSQHAAVRAISKYIQQAPEHTYTISAFGWRFLQFISSGEENLSP